MNVHPNYLNFLKQVEEYYSGLTIHEIMDRIDSFKRLNLRKISEEELKKELNKAIGFKVEGQFLSVVFHTKRIIPKGTRLYRVRSVKQDELIPPFSDMMNDSDAWNPPVRYVTKMGRLNNIGETLLYASLNYVSAIEELKIKEGEKFALIFYEAIKDIDVNIIGGWVYDTNLSSATNEKIRIVNNFLRDEFTKDVGEGTEHLYLTSNILAKHFYNRPNQDAWGYPSIYSKLDLNLCFKEKDIKNCLKLVGVQIVESFIEYSKGNYKENGNYIYNVNYIACDPNEDGIFNYYTINDDRCKEIFPNILNRKFEEDLQNKAFNIGSLNSFTKVTYSYKSRK